MLRAMDRIMDEAVDALLPSSVVEPIRTVARPAKVSAACRYGESNSPNWYVIALILVVHALLIAAIMHVRHQRRRPEEAHLTVLNLTQPVPPPAEETPPPPPSQPQVAAPIPVVRVPAPAPQISTTPTPPTVTVNPPSVAAPAPVVAMAAPVPSGIIQGGDLSTQMISGKPPRYPLESRRKREQGTVVLALTLGFDGAVETLTVARSSGYSRLDDAAKDAVRRWRWRPMIQQGQALKVKGIVEIPFVLQVSAA